MKTNRNRSGDLAAGAFAGLIGGFAMAGAAQIMYNLTSKQKRLQEESIEPRDPFIVLADKLQNLTGVEMTEQQKKIFEQCGATTIGVGAGIFYAALASKWKQHWLTKELHLERFSRL